MGREIERKFLVTGEEYRESGKPNLIKQGYLCNETGKAIRVRIAGNQGFITIKGKAAGISRPEWEYEIPVEDAAEMMSLCSGLIIEKIRYQVDFEGHIWEVDEFHGQNEGLVVAEIELEDEKDTVPLPAWIGEEVTADPKYLNANLVKKPYRCW